MWRWTKRLLLAGIMAVTLAAILGATYQTIATGRDLAAVPPPGQLVDVGGHRLHLWCTGSGEPVVILETGLGGTSADWGFVQPDVERFTRVCSYDRAGMGYSDAGPSPRTARRMAMELDQLLQRSGLTRPVVLVGASIGGLIVRVLASEQPARVAGLALVDASHEDQDADLPAVAPFVPFLSSAGVFRGLGISFGPPLASLAPFVRTFAAATRFRATGYRTAVNEMSHLADSAAEIRASRRDLPMPVIVITAGRGSDAAWHALQRDQASLSRRGCQIIAEQSGHAVAQGQPEIVVNAIRTLVEIARGVRSEC